MKLRVSAGKIQDQPADTLILPIFEKDALSGAAAELDQLAEGALGNLMEASDFRGKSGQLAVLYPTQAINVRRAILVGVGQAESVSLESLRQAGAAAIKRAEDHQAKVVALAIPSLASIPLEGAAQALVEGARLALYHFAAEKKIKENKTLPEVLDLLVSDAGGLEAARQGALTAVSIVDGVTLARDLVNMPPNVATPMRMAEAASKLAERHGFGLTIGDQAWAAEHKMGAFLGVAQGASTPAKFIVLEHNAGRSDLDTIVLVGKGITFDSGGISIKPSEKMGDMKSDMAGAAAVLGAMQAVGALNLPLHVVGITPCTENMPDGNAIRPADVLTASNGKTIEIISTDAEGRLVLADALVYAQQYQPKAVIDLATLTGACVIALGSGIAAGMFCNQDELRSRLMASAEHTHERLWPMPLWDDYKKAIKSDVADMKNSGGRTGGVGTSAIFLKEFTDYPWAHLDIAGMALTDKASAYTPSGATGYGVRLLVDFLCGWQTSAQ